MELNKTMVIHIPHSSWHIPDFLRPDFPVSDSELEENLAAFTDWGTEELFSHSSFPVKVVYPVSRIVCDPERFRSDSEEPMAARGIGANSQQVFGGKSFPRRKRRKTCKSR